MEPAEDKTPTPADRFISQGLRSLDRMNQGSPTNMQRRPVEQAPQPPLSPIRPANREYEQIECVYGDNLSEDSVMINEDRRKTEQAFKKPLGKMTAFFDKEESLLRKKKQFADVNTNPVKKQEMRDLCMKAAILNFRIDQMGLMVSLQQHHIMKPSPYGTDPFEQHLAEVEEMIFNELRQEHNKLMEKYANSSK